MATSAFSLYAKVVCLDVHHSHRQPLRENWEVHSPCRLWDIFLVPTASPICMGSIQVSSDIYICIYIYISQYIYIYIYNVYITTISVIYVSCPASPALNRHMTVAFANVASWDSQAAIHRHFCANARRSAGHDSSRDGWGWGSKSCDRLDESPSCFYVSSQNMYSLCYIYLSARLHNSTITHANASCYTIHACILEASKGVLQCMTMILRSSCGIS